MDTLASKMASVQEGVQCWRPGGKRAFLHDGVATWSAAALWGETFYLGKGREVAQCSV